MDYAVVHTMTIDERQVESVPIVLTGAPTTDEATIREAMGAAGVAPSDYGVLWANHRLVPIEGLSEDLRARWRLDLAQRLTWSSVIATTEDRVQLHTRIAKTLHQALRDIAQRRGQTLNDLVVEVLQNFANANRIMPL